MFFIILTPSTGSKAFSGICDSLCECVCLSVHKIKIKMAETKINKLGSPVLTRQLILGQKVKGHGHEVTQCKKAIEWLA